MRAASRSTVETIILMVGTIGPRCLQGFAAVVVSMVLLHCSAADEVDKIREQERNFNAVQCVYQDGVPHTDGRGALLRKDQAGKSFFPIAMWGTPVPGVVCGRGWQAGR